eukprot:13911359-Ditylum_brightwellii.AAC.1
MTVISTKNRSPVLHQIQWVGCSHFDELARPSDDFPAHLMGNVIDNIPETDSINPPPPFGDGNLCIISPPVVIPMSYEHNLAAGNLNLCQLEQMEEYHPIMNLWGDTLQ